MPLRRLVGFRAGDESEAKGNEKKAVSHGDKFWAKVMKIVDTKVCWFLSIMYDKNCMFLSNIDDEIRLILSSVNDKFVFLQS